MNIGYKEGDKVVCVKAHSGGGYIPPIHVDIIYCVSRIVFFQGKGRGVFLVGYPENVSIPLMVFLAALLIGDSAGWAA